MNKLNLLHKLVNEIFAAEVSWELKYDMIFSEAISRQIFEMIRLDYYDPDMDYEDDVRAFVEAFNLYMEEAKCLDYGY